MGFVLKIDRPDVSEEGSVWPRYEHLSDKDVITKTDAIRVTSTKHLARAQGSVVTILQEVAVFKPASHILVDSTDTE